MSTETRETETMLLKKAPKEPAAEGRTRTGEEQTERLARKIFEDYNALQRQRNPGRELEYPSWEEAPETVKKANRRQAAGIFEKAALLGYRAVPAGSKERGISAFSRQEIEFLARLEHKAWAEDRKRDGWSLGAFKDTGRRKTPYLTDYDALPEEIKELDRDAVRNVIPLLKSIGLKLCGRS